MANVTDPLARAVHGTNPQNLIEYITRQKIYDSRYWKEECFGLNAVDILEKAVKLTTLGGSFGENRKPCHFLALTLKMLQIQPDDNIIEQLIQDKTFKYVRALGAFYLRLTGRPKDIYELLEPLYHDNRKVST
jgi:pre-mRNA-splicing factor 38A